MPKIIISHDVLEPLKQVLLASRDVIISGRICGSKLQRVFTFCDGCWLPTYPVSVPFSIRGSVRLRARQGRQNECADSSALRVEAATGAGDLMMEEEDRNFARVKQMNPPTKQHYTPARKSYLHRFLVLELVSQKVTFQLHKNISLELILPENYITRIRFAIQKITCQNCLGIISWKISFNPPEKKKVFRNSFATISDWSVPPDIRCPFMEAFFGHIFLTV